MHLHRALPQNLPDLPICTLAPEAALRRTIGSLSSILSDAIRVIERAFLALVKQSTCDAAAPGIADGTPNACAS